MIPPVAMSSPDSLSFPRVSGDDPAAIMSYPSMLKFSPRERG